MNETTTMAIIIKLKYIFHARNIFLVVLSSFKMWAYDHSSVDICTRIKLPNTFEGYLATSAAIFRINPTRAKTLLFYCST